MLKFQECVGSTSSRFKVGYFYFLWIKIVQNFSSISLFERSRCACEFRSYLHLSFLRLVCEFLFFSSPFPFFVNKLLHFLYLILLSLLYHLKKWSKPYGERYEMEDLRAKRERMQRLKERRKKKEVVQFFF